VKQSGKQVATVLLFSTDTKLKAIDIYRYYKARFQIEFLFREAKQFFGLNNCQARHSKVLHFHFNATLTALNLIKWQDRQQAPDSSPKVLCVDSWKRRNFNEHLLKLFSEKLGFDLNWIKSKPEYELLRNYGTITT